MAGWHANRAIADPTPEDIDPGDGAKVKRCRACGLPATLPIACGVCGRPKSGGRLYEFELRLRGKRAGSIWLCEADYYQVNPIDPQAGDPLRVEDGAA